ncbi:MAG TPA: adenylate/guanylate cyclase domain-containing protein, partial [Anaerolineales bacterium]
MTEREQLEEAIAGLEGKRGILGDAVVEKALAPLRERLAALGPKSRTGVHTAVQPTASLVGERRVVSILFCDVKGSTSMAEQFDPEVWAGIINQALEYLTEPVRRHGGTVAEVRGDGILAFFGAPVAHEDDPQRSVIAGLEILDGIQAYREQLRRERGLDFNVRVGIHTGLVVVGEVGTEGQVEYTAIGDAVNLAARMEQTAWPGTVQISEQTYQLIEQLFECQPLGELKVKGKRQPVRTYRVIGLKAQPGPLRGLERQGLHSPLVGREAEFVVLKECLDRVIHGQGSIVGIFGEAGIGKSRLIAEVQEYATDLLWLEGHTLSFGQTISYWPFQQILRIWSSITEDDSESEAWTKLEKKVQDLFDEETTDYLPYLASLLALQVKGDYAERIKYLDGEALGKQIFFTARRFFERLAREQPIVIVFEDLHWMDESSTNLLEHLLPLVERVPILILGLSRPDYHTPASRLRERCLRDYADRFTEIQLLPLSDAESTRLVHNLLEIENLPTNLREIIVAKAEGNPFFLEEVIRTLIDTGMVRRDPASGRLQAIAHIESIHIPDTLQGVIMARVDRLDVEVKQTLRMAAVIGRSFLYRVLKAIAEAGHRLDDNLAELQQTELIREKRVTPELEYIFSHALAQETTYESILLLDRRELHARVGQAIEALFAERLEEFFGLLAYHYARAEAWERAQDYLLKAGDQAGRIAADAEALNYYEQAMKVYAHAFGDQWDPQKRASLERKIGEAFARRGEFPQAIDHFQRALDHLGYRLPVSRWEVRRALA